MIERERSRRLCRERKKPPHPVKCGDLPLHLAAANRADVQVAKALLEAFLNRPSMTGEYYCFQLHDNFENKAGLDVVTALLQAFKDATGRAEEYTDLPLHLAAANRAGVPIVKALLEAYLGAWAQ